MKNINDIQTSIILDKIYNSSLYRNNWLNSKNKEIKLYSIFKLDTNIKSIVDNFVIYLGISYENNMTSHIFYHFQISKINNINLCRILSVKNYKDFIDKSGYIKINNNTLFNNFIKEIERKL